MKDKYSIPFPVLYDTTVYTSNVLRDFFIRRRTEIKRAYKTGYYNYETNKFEVPEKDWLIITKNPNFKNDKDIIEMVGFRIIRK